MEILRHSEGEDILKEAMAEAGHLRDFGMPLAADIIERLCQALEESRKPRRESDGRGRPRKYEWGAIEVGGSLYSDKVERASLVSSAVHWAKVYCPAARFSSVKEGAGFRITRMA